MSAICQKERKIEKKTISNCLYIWVQMLHAYLQTVFDGDKLLKSEKYSFNFFWKTIEKRVVYKHTKNERKNHYMKRNERS